ncbi:hypothetical protein C8F01DRAFT_405068 [Mycena amicta]|nr:hypothetical protein C8F01DRAFT_405068 [Mycena amicta]
MRFSHLETQHDVKGLHLVHFEPSFPMPTNTVPYEILLKIQNDTPDTIQIICYPVGTHVFVESNQDIALVLTAGLTYQYTLKQLSPQRKAQLSVRAWDDLHCRASSVFVGAHSSGL